MTTPEPSSSSPPENQPSSTPRAAHITCYVLLGVLLAWVLVQRYFRPLVLGERITVAATQAADGTIAQTGESGGLPAGRIDERIDPNTATWTELTRLPRIGESIAKRIVEYRENQRSEGTGGTATQPVFTCPQDLDQVRGIGPKTVELIAPHLKFADSKPASSPD